WSIAQTGSKKWTLTQKAGGTHGTAPARVLSRPRRSLCGGEGRRSDARAQLRHRSVRGSPRVLERGGTGALRLSPARALRALPRVRASPRHDAAPLPRVPDRRARRAAPRRSPPRGLLRAAARLLPGRVDRRPPPQPDARGLDGRDALWPLHRERRGPPRDDLVVAARRRHDD